MADIVIGVIIDTLATLYALCYAAIPVVVFLACCKYIFS